MISNPGTGNAPPEAPLVSIVMNCFNGARFLREALQSVLAQTFSDWEIVFWDNQSTDDSARILKSYDDPRIRYHLASRHTGLGEARNLAVKEARGEWVAFLDCDDQWLPGKLEKQVRILKSEAGDLGLVYGRVRWLINGQDSDECCPSYKHRPLPEGDVLEELLMGSENFLTLATTLFRREVFWKVGGIPSDYYQAEDLYIFAEIAASHRVRALQEVCSRYRSHDHNLSRTQAYLGPLECARILERHAPRLRQTVAEARITAKLKELYTYSSLYQWRQGKGLVTPLIRLIRRGSLRTLTQIVSEAIDRRLSVRSLTLRPDGQPMEVK